MRMRAQANLISCSVGQYDDSGRASGSPTSRTIAVTRSTVNPATMPVPWHRSHGAFRHRPPQVAQGVLPPPPPHESQSAITPG